MISDVAYQQIRDSFMRDKLDDGAFAVALTIYQKNFESLISGGKSVQEAESTLLTDVTIASLKLQSAPLFKENARRVTKLDRVKAGFSSAVYNIFINIVANIVFIGLSIVVVLTMQDTAKNFINSLSGTGREIQAPSPRVNGARIVPQE